MNLLDPGVEGFRDFAFGDPGASPRDPDRQGAGADEMISRVAGNYFETFKAAPEGWGIEPNGINDSGASCGESRDFASGDPGASPRDPDPVRPGAIDGIVFRAAKSNSGI